MREYRQALGGFLTGITVVTTLDTYDNPRGLTANSFTSVSLTPPLVLVCIGTHAASYQAFEKCKAFAINVLAEDQKDVSSLFASKSEGKFGAIDWHRGMEGVPVLNHGVVHLECERREAFRCADHIILVGKVTRFSHKAQSPLGFFRGDYVSLTEDLSQKLQPETLRVSAQSN